MKKPRLREVHKMLIVVFAVFAAGFGAWALFRYAAAKDNAALACGIGFLCVSAGCFAYLRTSKYLQR